jgi:hypothetical protein
MKKGISKITAISVLFLFVVVVLGYTFMPQNIITRTKRLLRPSSIKYTDSIFTKINGKIFFKVGTTDKLELANTDVDSFTPLGGIYAKDKNRVYCCLDNCVVIPTSTDTFKSIESSIYATDGNFIYKNCEVLKNAEVKTFSYINKNYYQDKEGIYYNDTLIYNNTNGAIKSLSDNTITVDTIVFCNGKPVQNADLDTYEVLDNIYSKDRNNVYMWGKLMDTADSSTFYVISNGYGADNSNVYKMENIIENADPDTFISLDDYYQSDKDTVYYQGNPLDDADPKSFTSDNNGKAHDSNYKYLNGSIMEVAHNVMGAEDAIDPALISDEIKKGLSAMNGVSIDEMNLGISYYSNKYVSGTVNFINNESSQNNNWYAVNKDGSWEIIYTGNHIISCDIATQYKLALIIAPRCMDNSTGNIVTR